MNAMAILSRFARTCAEKVRKEVENQRMQMIIKFLKSAHKRNQNLGAIRALMARIKNLQRCLRLHLAQRRLEQIMFLHYYVKTERAVVYAPQYINQEVSDIRRAIRTYITQTTDVKGDKRKKGKIKTQRQQEHDAQMDKLIAMGPDKMSDIELLRKAEGIALIPARALTPLRYMRPLCWEASLEYHRRLVATIDNIKNAKHVKDTFFKFTSNLHPATASVGQIEAFDPDELGLPMPTVEELKELVRDGREDAGLSILPELKPVK
eukprot:TRINITY_DN35544_c0_g2_i1.p1 TRINITY_DN35544_c0_g2~~TRINITY_DN35544_c0_g2_i1.p1  ORF type:complete len:285 (+),score=10.96 TRINITY_DN35544_c0_g2_i1:64-855(+)